MIVKNKNESCSDESTKLSEQDEQNLITEIAKGNHISFTKLMRLYQSKVRAYSQIYSNQVNEHIDDLAQDIFLQIYQSCQNFKGKSKVSTWIFSIAKYTINNKLRKKKLLYFWKIPTFVEKANTENSFRCDKDGAFYYESEENKQLLKNCLLELKPQHQEVIALYEFADLNYEQIANVLNISIGTVKSRIFNGRKALTSKVSKNYA